MSSINLSAQRKSYWHYRENPFSFSIRAGVNLSSLSGADHSRTKFGVNLGAMVDYNLPLSFPLALQTGIEYTSKGAEDVLTRNAKLDYLQIPIYAAYKLPVSDASKIVFAIGPYFAYGIHGSHYYLDPFKEDLLKRFDWGVGGGAGIEVRKFVGFLGVEKGLTNISKMEQKDGDLKSLKTLNIKLSVGYKF